MNYDRFNNKSILIWGYGREGKSTEQFLKRCACPARVKIFEGKWEEIDGDYDYVIKSPGIVCEEENEKLTSQTEIFLEAFRDQVIGITGTKGKSTTAALLAHVLKETMNRQVILLGNIGEPCLNHFDEIDEDTVVVFEMSCHQLAHTKISPHIAVFLNLYEEHLDYYGTFEKYFQAKKNITKYQTRRDFLYVGAQVPKIDTSAEIIKIDHAQDYGLKILGDHNNYNAEFVYRIATERYGADAELVRKSMKGFDGLPHRLQFIGEKDGRAYYDDSISTIPGATISAMKAVKNAYAVLIGGMDRGIDYEELVRYIEQDQDHAYIFMYDSGKRIYDEVSHRKNCFYEKDLKQALRRAEDVTPEGKAILLSPAAASYGTFKNFEERGEYFRIYAGL